MKAVEQRQHHRRRGIYLLPNLLTTIGLFAGFYAVVAAMKGLFDHAAIAVYIALVIDSCDGRVARMTGTQSDFGAQYDSLSDMIGFGIAPALVAYSLLLHKLGRIGWLIAFCYAAATAMRLARFNADSYTTKRYFRGLPCPSAAALIAALVWNTNLFKLHDHMVVVAMGVIMLIVALLMVSNIHYLSFKDLDFKGRVPFFAIAVVVLSIVAIAWRPPQVLFAGFFLYVLSGPLLVLHRVKRRRRRRKRG
ncbi:MAG: CDP-diacylglycerol--serine O-phosphatidyltransferase [Gammaproteobacteria bacterium]|nr:CDP-diacylglycerol--serine O-phosphatidyltransferase [Gammaproteobacteria bacterium]